jgi:hypothetical protein
MVSYYENNPVACSNRPYDDCWLPKYLEEKERRLKGECSGKQTDLVCSFRLPLEVTSWLIEKAKPLSYAVYIKNQVIKSYEQSHIPVTKNIDESEVMNLPIYNWHIHKGGEAVRVNSTKGWTPTIAPTLDEEGHPVA